MVFFDVLAFDTLSWSIGLTAQQAQLKYSLYTASSQECLWTGV